MILRFRCPYVIVTSHSFIHNFSDAVSPLIYVVFKIFLMSFVCDLFPGLILNLNYGKVLSLSPTIITQLMFNLSATLTVDHRKALNDFTSSLPLSEAVESPANHEKVLKSVTIMQYLLEAQKIAVELLANICSGDGMLWFQYNANDLKSYFGLKIWTLKFMN